MFIANGLRSDHPDPALPFADDALLPLEDRHAIEAIGRNKGEGLWGRTDTYDGDYWRAFTTIPDQPDLAWFVLGHPTHGKSVYLVKDEDAPMLHSDLPHSAVTVRNGGYWWDGDAWHRPEVYNPARGIYDDILVPEARSIIGEPREGEPYTADSLNAHFNRNPGARIEAWLRGRELTVPPILGLIAPELEEGALINTAEVAERAGIAVSTFRAYLSRNENAVPAPQSTVGGANRWAIPVIDAWVANRARDPRSVLQGLLPDTGISPGVARVHEQAVTMVKAEMAFVTGAAASRLANRIVGSAAALQRLLPIQALIETTMDALRSDYSRGFGLFFGERNLEVLHWLILHFPGELMGPVRSLVRVASEKTDTTPQGVVHALLLTSAPDPYVQGYLERVIEGL